MCQYLLFFRVLLGYLLTSDNKSKSYLLLPGGPLAFLALKNDDLFCLPLSGFWVWGSSSPTPTQGSHTMTGEWQKFSMGWQGSSLWSLPPRRWGSCRHTEEGIEVPVHFRLLHSPPPLFPSISSWRKLVARKRQTWLPMLARRGSSVRKLSHHMRAVRQRGKQPCMQSRGKGH